MKRPAQSGILTVIGFVVGTAAYNGLFLNFVKPTLRWPLLVASAVVTAIGVYGLFAAEGGEPHEDAPAAHLEHADGTTAAVPAALAAEPPAPHDHVTGPRIGWLLVVPFLLMGVVVPPPLGAFSAQQDSGLVRTVDSADGLPPLPAGDPVALSLSEYSARALYDDSRPLSGRTVRLTGFVSPRKGGAGWVLTRMVLSCCAADGYAVKIDVEGGQKLPVDTWVEVEGEWVPTPPAAAGGQEGLPIVRIAQIRRVAAPENPYE